MNSTNREILVKNIYIDWTGLVKKFIQFYFFPSEVLVFFDFISNPEDRSLII